MIMSLKQRKINFKSKKKTEPQHIYKDWKTVQSCSAIEIRTDKKE